MVDEIKKGERERECVCVYVCESGREIDLRSVL